MAERVLISLENIELTFGGKPLFEGLRVHICDGDRICLIGKNGAGKTTLMRLIMAEQEPDRGERFSLPGLTLGYLPQTVAHAEGDNVKSFVLSGLNKADQTEERHHLADIIIEPLALEEHASMDTLSGGQLRRAALARALVSQPDILLLDEPTNHLDVGAIEWLEHYLASFRGALVCVSHDRAFLSAVSRKVFWIDRGLVRVCPGTYSAFPAWQEQIIEQEARELQNMQKKLAAEIDWTQGGVTARRKRNQRRLSELHRLREKLKGDKAAYSQRMRTIEADHLTPGQASKIVAEFRHVSKSFRQGNKNIPILKDFSFRILRGDRIGILGKNGSGKNTFVRLLTGDIAPDEGQVFRGKHLDIAYFDQGRVQLNPNKTLWDTLCPNGGDYVFLGSGEEQRPIHVCGYLKNFLFDPRLARDRVGTLSGGQQNRLMLAKLLANPGNVLILDEPTNDLDMDTLDMLQELLAEYTGTLLIVSHDRDFLDRSVTEVLAFEGEAIVEGYMGGYSDYHSHKLKTQETVEKKKLAAEKKRPAKIDDKPKPPMTRMSFKFVHELEKLPGRIAALEQEIITLQETLSDPDFYAADPQKFRDSGRRLAEARRELESAEHRWLELEEMRAKIG